MCASCGNRSIPVTPQVTLTVARWRWPRPWLAFTWWRYAASAPGSAVRECASQATAREGPGGAQGRAGTVGQGHRGRNLALAEALGLQVDETPDPEKLTVEIKAIRDELQAETENAHSRERELTVELQLMRQAAKRGANAELLADSRSFMSKLAGARPRVRLVLRRPRRPDQDHQHLGRRLASRECARMYRIYHVRVPAFGV